jgi:hypothetical protein
MMASLQMGGHRKKIRGSKDVLSGAKFVAKWEQIITYRTKLQRKYFLTLHRKKHQHSVSRIAPGASSKG